MKNDISPDFKTPHFKEIRQRFEQAMSEGYRTYFESDDLLLLAEYYATNGRFDQSDTAVDYALSLHPDNPDVQTFKCGNLMAQGKFDQAEQLLDVLSDQNDREVLLLRAQLLLNKNLTEEAVRLFDHLYRQERSLDTMLDIVDVCLDAYQYDLAKEWLDMAYAEAPHHPDVLETMVDYLHSSGNDDYLPPFLNELIDLYPYESRYWKNLAHSYMGMNEPEKAHDAIDFALAINDKDPMAYQIKGGICLMENDTDRAIAAFEKAEAYSNDKSMAWMALMQCYYYLKDYPRCEKYAELTLSLPNLNDSEKASACQKLADCFIKKGELEKAYEQLTLSQQLDKENYQLYLTWGELMFCIGKKEEALVFLHNGLLLAEQTELEVEATETAAQICLSGGEWLQALEWFEVVDRKDSEFNRCNYLPMAYCCFRLDREQQAISYLQKTMAFSPESFDDGLYQQLAGVDRKFYQLAESIRRRGSGQP